MKFSKRKTINKLKNRRKEAVYKKRRFIIFLTTILLVLGGIYTVKTILGRDNKVSTNADTEESNDLDDYTTNIDNTHKLDNSGYLSLEEDSNAEDAIQLSEIIYKRRNGEIKYPVRTDGKKVVYLTFDDGPSTTNTPTVLDILKENDIKATFFIQGKNAELNAKSKEILKRTVEEGHAIGNHTYGHDSDYLSPKLPGNKRGTMIADNILADIEKCNNVLKGILGNDFYTRVIRIPGGTISWNGQAEIKSVFNENGIASIDWDSLNSDAEGKKKNAAELIEVSKKNLDLLGKDADSVVFLMHDTYYKEETAKSLQGIIDLFKERGFEFKTIK